VGLAAVLAIMVLAWPELKPNRITNVEDNTNTQKNPPGWIITDNTTVAGKFEIISRQFKNSIFSILAC
jgi:hypothetical protein